MPVFLARPLISVVRRFCECGKLDAIEPYWIKPSMIHNTDSFEDWLEGFASIPFTSAQLNDLKARAEQVSASEVKQLVKEIELLRSLLNSLLEYSENLDREPQSKTFETASRNQLFDLVQFMLSRRD
jgi:hypothetical protein